ncbi:unnamed protein product, partial [Vitis vinifera]
MYNSKIRVCWIHGVGNSPPRKQKFPMAKISQDKLDYSSLLHGKYELGRLLGHGTFAKVYHARNLRNGESVAMKVVAKDKNLLLDEQGNLKVTDFGLCALSDHLKQDGLLHTACGTPAYVAPEVIAKRGYDGAKADIWSCGVILFVLMAGFLPFQDDNLIAMYKKIYRGDFKCPPWFSPEARRVVCRLLDPNPNTRITISKLKETSWFKKTKPKNVQTTASGVAVEEEMEVKEKVPEALNAFHIISLSEGFDLSPLFEEKKKEEEEEMRFATLKKSMSDVVLKLEELTKPGMFPMTPALGGDSVDQYNQSCGKELRPAVEGIGWTATQNSAILTAPHIIERRKS